VIALKVEDLVLIAGRTLGLATGQVLDLLDVAAAERALAQVRPVGEPAADAAVLLHALLRQRPLRRGNQRVALAAMLQFLALNGQDLARRGRSRPWSRSSRPERSALRTPRAGWRPGCGPAAARPG
jgi:hypothetical protein